MLVHYTSECMVLIININRIVKEPICGYQNIDSGQNFIFSEYVKVIESSYMQKYIILINTFLTQRWFYLGMKSLAW